ncbi:GTPase [Candidatus Woesearchaeota archaeon]|nr:GTPase [Candidatus Woesearchaeota archaeon]MBT7148511.1 GTPase [Candidatus Woesearchaeota archaeon]
MVKKNVIIMGAAGRDFHNFLVYFKDNPYYRVICFTAEQIPGISNRKFPAKLAGKYYKQGIPIYKESTLPSLIKKHKVKNVYLSYSDLSHTDVMHKASIVMANGANFYLLGPDETQIKSKKPLISVTAVRTGAGKSQTSRKVAEILRNQGHKVVAIRHPMPYGDLVKQEVQRFSSYEDVIKHKCTIEEREEYDPWVQLGIPIYAGVDYKKILKEAEKEADVIIWDGGNNDMSFYKADLDIVVVDPHRAGQELTYHPGEVNFRLADVIVINKVDSARKDQVEKIKEDIKKYNPKAKVIIAASDLIISSEKPLKGKKVLVVGDGPTLTHGGMSFGAGTIAAKRYGAIIIDPKPFLVGTLKEVYEKYPHLKKGKELPAMGYSEKQNKDLQKTINKSKADIIIDGTPVNLKKQITLKKDFVEVDYVLREIGRPNLKDVLKSVKIKER